MTKATTVEAGDYFRLTMEDGMLIYVRIDEGSKGGRAFGTGFSVLTPRGESGDFEVDDLRDRITAEQFEQAQRCGFVTPAGYVAPAPLTTAEAEKATGFIKRQGMN